MIGETGAVTGQIVNERLARENPAVQNEQQQPREPEVEQQEQSFSDVTSFSPEALALARNVTATAGSQAREEAEPTGQNPQEAENPTSRFLSIRV